MIEDELTFFYLNKYLIFLICLIVIPACPESQLVLNRYYFSLDRIITFQHNKLEEWERGFMVDDRIIMLYKNPLKELYEISHINNG